MAIRVSLMATEFAYGRLRTPFRIDGIHRCSLMVDGVSLMDELGIPMRSLKTWLSDDGVNG